MKPVIVAALLALLAGCAATPAPPPEQAATYALTNCTDIGVGQRLRPIDVIRQCMNRNGSAISTIYQRAVEVDRNTRGLVVLHLKIDRHGYAAVKATSDGPAISDRFRRELEDYVRRLQFPAALAGVEEEYTLDFFVRK